MEYERRYFGAIAVFYPKTALPLLFSSLAPIFSSSGGQLAIELPEGYPAAAARLYSLHGRLAFQQRLAGGLNELYLPLPPGLYILEVELPHGERVRQKIVLAR